MADRPAIDGYWLPGLKGERPDYEEREFGPVGVRVRVPVLTAELLGRMVGRLREARARHLADRPVEEIVEAIGEAARRLTSPGGAEHRELMETLPGLTGYSAAMIEVGLERMGRTWTAEGLNRALAAEFTDPAVLDAYRPRPSGGRHRAYGPGLTVHLFSGNIPGVAVTSLVRAFCVKSASLGKTAAGEPFFPVRFARTLAEVDPGLAECVAVTYWEGGREELEGAVFAEADAIIAYGADETISDVRARVPAGVRFLGYPTRVGAGVIAAGALGGRQEAEALARAAARDVVAFDQQGCVAPHVLFVERGGATGPERFAEGLAAALEEAAGRMPRKAMDPGESAAIHQLRAEAEVRGATVLASAGGTEWTVVVEEGRGFEPSPLNRVIRVHPVDAVEEALEGLAEVGRRLQTVALAANPEQAESLAEKLGALGATRIVPVGSTAWPAPDWHHDGRFQFLDLVRFVDLEV
jgi:hypothetical protein